MHSSNKTALQPTYAYAPTSSLPGEVPSLCPYDAIVTQESSVTSPWHHFRFRACGVLLMCTEALVYLFVTRSTVPGILSESLKNTNKIQ